MQYFKATKRQATAYVGIVVTRINFYFQGADAATIDHSTHRPWQCVPNVISLINSFTFAVKTFLVIFP
ncbi:Uncharacterized protein TCM_011644 [Theobroma cacao]|uniref:Uncharacterized protein n=1 Tax=Theobroma cacao TaxID=3641 RepID=A0A061EA70_THECC|nr:Uncharacterized protein TCM_011644 [Theobroma cacao]